MKFARENYSTELIAEMVPLWKEHYSEIADPIYQKLNPDLGIYKTCNERGVLRIFTARQKNSLIGYQVFFVGPHPHHRESIQAQQDILFVSPSARVGLNGYRFIKWCADELRKEGVQIVHQRISAHHDFGPMLKRMGYELEDLTYSKQLQEVR